MKELFTICFFIFSISAFGNGVKIKVVMPEKVNSETEFEVTVTIIKGTIDGFARMEFEIPEGFKVVSVENSGAAFSFTPPKLKYIWMTVPKSPEFTIKYKVVTSVDLDGFYDLRGVFSYIDNDRAKTVKTIKSIILERNDALLAQQESQRLADEEAKRIEALEKRKAELEAIRRSEEQLKTQLADDAARKAADEEAKRRAAEEEARRKQLADDAARKSADEEAKRRAAEEEARRKQLADEAARKSADEEAKRRAAEEEARRKQLADDAARKATDEEAKRRAAEEEARRKQLADDAARKATDEEAKRRAAEEEARRKQLAEDAARKSADEEAKRRAAEEEARRKQLAEDAARKATDEEAKRRAAEEEARKRQLADEAARKAADQDRRRIEEEKAAAMAKNTRKEAAPSYSSELTYHVQIAAYKNPPADSHYAGVKELQKIVPDDGLTRFFSGSFQNIRDAQARKNELNAMGHKEAFVVAYQNGKRAAIPSKSTPVTSEDKGPVKESIVSKPANASTSSNRKDIFFKVQVGSYKTDMPVQVISQLLDLEELEVQKFETGYTRYFSGKFNDYNEAMKRKEKVVRGGITDAFIVAFYKGEMIPLNEAFELLK
jgi:chemotaxis protein histidine kinase CheA